MGAYDGCYKYTKELVLKGNHNWFLNLHFVITVLQIYQRTCFERKSQPIQYTEILKMRCYKYTKELVLKGNHNHFINQRFRNVGVTNIPKNLFWKEITTTNSLKYSESWVLQIYQRTCFERKSQQGRERMSIILGVTNIPKNLFWKEITTLIAWIHQRHMVLQIYQRTCFERKSQRWVICPATLLRCYKYTKELVLKGNHNVKPVYKNGVFGVTNIPKNLFWKEITTPPVVGTNQC